jgi:hypothetical protein
VRNPWHAEGKISGPEDTIRGRESTMADLIAIGYPDEATADAAADEA